MKRVLVTGASGFIGRQSLPRLLATGYEVHGVGRTGSGAGTSPVIWHSADLLNAKEMADVVKEVKPSHLLHFAWYAIPGEYWTSPENLRWVEASLELIRLFVSVGGERAVFAGTCAEYDWSDGHCVEGVTPLAPSTLYGVCKNSLQQMLSAYARLAGLSFGWGRIFSLFGPYEYESRLIPSVILALLRGEEVKTSPGDQVRDYLYVGDVASAFVALLESSVEGPVNIASGKAIAVKDLISMTMAAVPGEHRVRFGGLPPRDEPPLIVADTKRLNTIVGWQPSQSREEGLRLTVEWFSGHAAVTAAVRA